MQTVADDTRQKVGGDVDEPGGVFVRKPAGRIDNSRGGAPSTRTSIPFHSLTHTPPPPPPRVRNLSSSSLSSISSSLTTETGRKIHAIIVPLLHS